MYGQAIKEIPYFGVTYYKRSYINGKLTQVKQQSVVLTTPINVDSVFDGKSPAEYRGYLTQALSKAKRQQQDYEYKSYQ